ncbi:hypothetical protein NQ315_011738 [Exocentrus adspersus]|uniref:Crossover junction endonuclease EME1 n=1 Tax=Exocentrus adspersus TaxID=1586481 RepID=A0AAV8W0D6_9CUCU|nr:hypothetical protein NQ315_011738 [Exocentrus adspersus]
MYKFSESEDKLSSLNSDEPSDSDIENILQKYKDEEALIGGSDSDLADKPGKSKSRKRQALDAQREERSAQKLKKLQEAKAKQALRNFEKQAKKEAIEQQKLLKQSLKAAAKSIKPEECMRYMTVELDCEIDQTPYGAILKEALAKSDITCKTTSQVVPNLISWSRQVQALDDNMQLKQSNVSLKHFLLIMLGSEFKEHISKNTLLAHVKNMFALTQCKQFTIAVYIEEKLNPNQETVIIETQMLTRCDFRFVKELEDLTELLLQATKAVAQIPHKLKREEKYKLLNEYFSDSNKDTVKVDANGNGLNRLWQQMLCMFPLARLETAEAITAVYPTPAALFQAYETCGCKKEELLQDLCIRRARGPCTVARRIGPELSRKCCNFFCAKENVFL